ncbi:MULTISPECIES: ABC transporter substrate-binding protein [Mycolicibacterium]|jgi:putative spermidine/putrescine transport system substrate-binding protein|uniref:ABC transporter substrate-binding protein n=3 Tax=Mycolicibacterium fortuitum TaxID=1766 RepID=A0A0N9YIR8_MYCFO|nr:MULTISPECIES: extracellular solute-binding protein [Mycolicibacterium]AIY48910.1 Ferric iron ABC transporter, iron-binding protein [Mycobacterium sp. VKM Ac-1817D]CRL70524.1 polyamine/opine/phosphonate ABC transporter periplasmic ligand-binding protein [Mycolicibacter nonchromogenicus]ALI29683.1 Ferric iron ABC transporter, iron-binding protein [Mycolicibacterium fortuitum]AMD56162.1 ABC transporter substrate-binding protein [Mycolicibacterium fortuitum subsp. fortuitum DSM 46621 = ATCC 6841
MITSRIVTASAALAASTLVAVGLAACAPPERDAAGGKTDTGVKVAEARSAADFGGMDKLIEAAKAEGELNVIALPPDWANYGAIIKAFEEKYGIEVNSAQPDGSSQEEINAANQQKGKSTAPDVFDLGQSVALANTSMFAPYKVATFDDIQENLKDPDGTWVNDYGGFMSIGFDSTKVPPITSVEDLLKPEYHGKVALNGDPTQAGAAFAGVLMAAVAQGGSADDIAPGVQFFEKLNDVGNFLPLDPTPATIESGQTPVVIDWNYLNGTESQKVPGWQVMVPHEALVAGYYYQAINKDAPHPAAARLWQEFLFSDEGQNLYAKGGVRPVRADKMILAGTADRAAFGQLPPIDGPVTVATQAQTDVANRYLADNWAKAIG